MGWYYNNSGSRKDLIRQLTECRSSAKQDITVTSTCLAHCFRGSVFCGVLWTVWERTFTKEAAQVEPTERWIDCDLIRCAQKQWGYKPMDEMAHPYFYSCPLSYLDLVPIHQFGGREGWRLEVKRHHAKQMEKRIHKKLMASK